MIAELDNAIMAEQNDVNTTLHQIQIAEAGLKSIAKKHQYAQHYLEIKRVEQSVKRVSRPYRGKRLKIVRRGKV